MKNKIKYIGIRGYRGSGKNTIAYLLGNIIQFIIDNYDNYKPYTSELLDDHSFNLFYRVCCNCIKNDEQEAINGMNTQNVYLESFGSTPKMLVELLTGIPHEYFNSDYHKDHILVKLNDFSWKIVDDPVQVTFDHSMLMSEIDKENITEIDNEDITLSLRELIVYFATVSMKYLGRSVWVKSVKCSEHEYDDFDSYYNIGTQYKIFTDIKAPSELSFIKSHQGHIIKIERPEFKKRDRGVELLESDKRWDYEVCIEKDILEDDKLKERLISIALELL